MVDIASNVCLVDTSLSLEPCNRALHVLRVTIRVGWAIDSASSAHRAIRPTISLPLTTVHSVLQENLWLLNPQDNVQLALRITTQTLRAVPTASFVHRVISVT
jgi:hypothetical protein